MPPTQLALAVLPREYWTLARGNYNYSSYCLDWETTFVGMHAPDSVGPHGSHDTDGAMEDSSWRESDLPSYCLDRTLILLECPSFTVGRAPKVAWSAFARPGLD